jgi:threonylcarbamoyladenosine tRNA methylthiotransferase MtaB
MIKFTITTLGCKVNQYESDAIARRLMDLGCVPAVAEEPADVGIVNTCSVTGKAAMQSRQAVRQLIRTNPRAQIVVTGCYAQTEPGELGKIDGVHRIIGHGDKHHIPDIILSGKNDTLFPAVMRRNIQSEKHFKHIPVPVSGSRTRPVLKIQDGCNAFCTYCIVPYARGKSRSMPLERVLESIRSLKQAGFHEVVLSGVHLGAYGFDLLPQTGLKDLLVRIRDADAMDRVRLSSIEPRELAQDIVEMVATSNIFCKHFHIPLQSGDDGILEKMHRDYSRAFFEDLIYKMKKRIPGAAIGVDLLIGFPGEAENAFESTYSLIEKLPITYLHVFPFSPRPGTPAERYPKKVPAKTIKERCERMRRLGNEKKNVFYKKFEGKTVQVLIESKRDSATGLLKGITSNYIPIFVAGTDDFFNTLVQVTIEKIERNNTVFGVVC